jgi:hypothetical protein
LFSETEGGRIAPILVLLKSRNKEMVMRSLITLSIATVLILSISLLGQETLSQSEVSDILDQLIQQQRTRWIQTGTMEVRHTEYRAPILTDPAAIEAKIEQALADFESDPDGIIKTEELQAQTREAIPFNMRYEYANETTTTTSELVKVDQDRHSQDITIESRIESVTKPSSLAYNEMTNDMDLSGNQRRIFAWDGQNYTLYNLPINIAIVDASNRFDQAGIASLKAGLIPWGRGMFSKDNLMDAQVSWEASRNGELFISFVWDLGIEFMITLNAKRSFAPISYSLVRPDGSIQTAELSEYRQINRSWIPHEILTERYEAGYQRLLGYDLWEIIDISTLKPRPNEFSAEYHEKASISHYSPLSNEPLRYHHNSRVDTQALLSRRLNAQGSAHSHPQNCATLSIAYAAEKLGKSIPDEQLSDIVDASGYTTLLQMKSLAQSLGLSAEVVKTDIPGLTQYAEAQVILHLPGKNHFVILDHVDSENVWCIDLFRNRFYYSIHFGPFGATWSEGTALIISNNPISVPKSDTVIPDAGARAIAGRGGIIGTCTKVLQSSSTHYCPMDCIGKFYHFFKVMGCEDAPTGSCDPNTRILSRLSTNCIADIIGDCLATTWIYGYMWGCED